MNILDGKLVSTQILNDVRDKIEGHIEESESRLGYKISKPSMAIVLVGNNPASESYVKGKAIGGRVSETDAVYVVINDLGNRISYYNGRFELIDKTRERKLNEILGGE